MCPCGYVYVSADALGSVRRGHQILCIWSCRNYEHFLVVVVVVVLGCFGEGLCDRLELLRHSDLQTE